MFLVTVKIIIDTYFTIYLLYFYVLTQVLGKQNNDPENHAESSVRPKFALY